MSKGLQITLLILVLTSFTTYSQNTKELVQNVSPQMSQAPIGVKALPSLRERFQEIEGTYTIDYNLMNYSVLRTEDLFNAIEGARLPEVNATFEWDQYTSITVFPTGTIGNSDSPN